MPTTYEPIATTTLGSATNSISFASISNAYTDLVISFVTTMATTAASAFMRFNDDTGTNYTRTRLSGDGATVTGSFSTSENAIDLGFGNLSTSTPCSFIINIMSYAGSTRKAALVQANRDQNGSGIVNYAIGLWNSTSAINKVTLASAQNFATGTTATLYGILKA